MLAFGLDSLIELASAGVLMWQLSIELRYGQKISERTEHIASRFGGGLRTFDKAGFSSLC